MPSRPNGSAAANGAPKSSFAKRFELPALDFKFSSLTEGTNIPPPMPSPKAEAPPPPPPPPPKQAPAAKDKDKDHGTTKSSLTSQANGSEKTPKPDAIDTSAAGAGLKRPLEESPASPTMSTSRGSLRRLLSRSFLNSSTYDDKASISGQSQIQSPSQPYPRAPSRASMNTTDERKSKRTSGWFRRLRSGGGADAAPAADHEDTGRPSHQFEIARKPVGPPPPMIPELSALESKVDTKIGDDLFKGIK